MLCMIPSVSHPDAPPAEAVGRMMPFNEALVQAGALIALDGCSLTCEGRAWRVWLWKDDRDQWAVHRGGRRDRQRWDDPGELDGRSGRMGQAVPRLGRRCDRGSRGVREVGFPLPTSSRPQITPRCAQIDTRQRIATVHQENMMKYI